MAWPNVYRVLFIAAIFTDLLNGLVHNNALRFIKLKGRGFHVFGHHAEKIRIPRPFWSSEDIVITVRIDGKSFIAVQPTSKGSDRYEISQRIVSIIPIFAKV
jgi:hypothetical protein